MSARSIRRAILLGPVGPARRQKGLSPGARDVVIGVDAGTAVWRRAGFRADVAVGDFDGLSRLGGAARASLFSGGLRRVRLRPDKDFSDLHYAVELARALGARELCCLGVIGGARLDHHLAALYELARASASGSFSRVWALAPAGEYHFVSPATGPLRLRGGQARPRRTVSVLPIGGPARGVRLRGFRYGFGNRPGTLSVSSRGLSNVLTAASCEVAVKRGTLAVIFT